MGNLALTPSCCLCALTSLGPRLLQLKMFTVLFAITAFGNESCNAKMGQNQGVLKKKY